jgi:hypothetical protein
MKRLVTRAMARGLTETLSVLSFSKEGSSHQLNT